MTWSLGNTCLSGQKSEEQEPLLPSREPDTVEGYLAILKNGGFASSCYESGKVCTEATEYLFSCSDQALRDILLMETKHFGFLTKFAVDLYNSVFKGNIFKNDDEKRRTIIDRMCRAMSMIEPSATTDLRSFRYAVLLEHCAEADFYQNEKNIAARPDYFKDMQRLESFSHDARRMLVCLLKFETAVGLWELWEKRGPMVVSAIKTWIDSSSDDEHFEESTVYQNPKHPSFPDMAHDVQRQIAHSNRACFRTWRALRKLTFALEGPDAAPGSGRDDELLKKVQEMLEEPPSRTPVIGYHWTDHGLPAGL